MIVFENVGLRYGTGPEILRDVTFTLSPGSFHFLTGASGAGKTSLLKLMYLGMRPSRGLIRIFDEDVSRIDRGSLPYLRRRIGMVFQDFRLLGHLTAFENVALPLRLQKASDEEITNNVTELLDWVGLGDYLHARPATLSGGQQQRVAIARAVIARPSLILADEPTGNVDEEIGWRLMRLFDQLNRYGTTMVIATHNDSVVQRINRPCLNLEDGRLTRLPAE